LGVVERFTLDLDRSRLREGVRLAVTAGVEHVFATADAQLFVVARVPDAEVDRGLAPAFETGAVESVDVSPLVGADRFPGLGEATLGLDCAECGNTLTSDGVSATVGEETDDLCCESCEARFRERYEDLKEVDHRLSKGQTASTWVPYRDT
jgi:hypothetical protein